jgi:sucrose phosphorylase
MARGIDACAHHAALSTGTIAVLGSGIDMPYPASNLDLYQVNCTFFDALGRDEQAYLLARAIQFFLPGIPQVYYVGLLAGENDMALLAKTQVGRDINRHRYSMQEIDAAWDKAVVRDLIDLIRLRNEHPAFGGAFELLDTVDHTLAMRWTAGASRAEMRADLKTHQVDLIVDDGAGPRTVPLRRHRSAA